MIEYRAMLRESKNFESGLTLEAGSVVYVQETPHGWIGRFFPDPVKPSASVFALEEREFSVFERHEYMEVELVVTPEPEVSAEEWEAERESERMLARRRMQNRVTVHMEEAARLTKLLETGF